MNFISKKSNHNLIFINSKILSVGQKMKLNYSTRKNVVLFPKDGVISILIPANSYLEASEPKSVNPD